MQPTDTHPTEHQAGHLIDKGHDAPPDTHAGHSHIEMHRVTDAEVAALSPKPEAPAEKPKRASSNTKSNTQRVRGTPHFYISGGKLLMSLDYTVNGDDINAVGGFVPWSFVDVSDTNVIEVSKEYDKVRKRT